MLEHYAHHVVEFIHAHPYWGQFITFLIAFSESLAIIGTIIPGSVTMTAVGTLVGSAIFPASTTILMATLGALAGDWIGYLFGKYYANEIRDFRIFKRYQKLFDNGEAFFHKHGGKSVIIGRFFGPVRSFVPLIAGILQMPILRFTAAVIPAALLWSFAYMLPGILLGALSLEMPAGMATKFILYGLFGILVIWIMSVVVKLFFQTIWAMFDQFTLRLWSKIRENKKLNWLTKFLSDHQQPDRHRQLALLFIIFICTLLLVILCINVKNHGILTALNEPLFHLLTSIRTPLLDNIFVTITLLGSNIVKFSISFLILIPFVMYKFWRTSFHWIFNTFLIFSSTQLLKHFIYSPRPIQFIAESSFPSGHVTFTFGVLGFLAVIIGTHLPNEKKRTPYIIISILTLLMAFSRLYLGAHWLTDVVAGVLLALICLSISSISYRRNFLKPIPVIKFSIISGSIILIIWATSVLFQFKNEYKKYRVDTAIMEINDTQWWTTNYDEIPHYQINRLGNPKFPFNIQWKDSPDNIKVNLEKKGWTSFTTSGNIKGIIERLSASQNNIHLFLLPQLYLNKAPVLMMLKMDKDGNPLLKLQLWETNIFSSDQKMILLGTISEYLSPKQKYENNNFKDVTPEFSKIFRTITSKKFLRPHHTIKICLVGMGLY